MFMLHRSLPVCVLACIWLANTLSRQMTLHSGPTNVEPGSTFLLGWPCAFFLWEPSVPIEWPQLNKLGNCVFKIGTNAALHTLWFRQLTGISVYLLFEQHYCSSWGFRIHQGQLSDSKWGRGKCCTLTFPRINLLVTSLLILPTGHRSPLPAYHSLYSHILYLTWSVFPTGMIKPYTLFSIWTYDLWWIVFQPKCCSDGLKSIWNSFPPHRPDVGIGWVVSDNFL